MHCANASIWFRRAADSGVGLPPFGRCDLHACIADWNAGPLTLTPLTFVVPGVFWTTTPPLPLAVGSGKFCTPWERMHEAKASPRAWSAGSAVVPLPAPLEEEFDEEPHAASERLTAIRAATRRRDVIDDMRKWYETGGYGAGTGAVTAA